MGSRRKLINNNIAAGIIINFSLFNIISYLFTPLITIQKKKKKFKILISIKFCSSLYNCVHDK